MARSRIPWAVIAVATIAVVTYALLVGSADARQLEDTLVSTGRAGPFEVGMSVNEVYELVGRENVELFDAYREGYFEPAIAITLEGSEVSPAIVAPVREWPCFEWSIQGIRVHDVRFRTADGIGVGSTLGELREAYDDSFVSNEAGPHAWVESTSMNFGLENGSGSDDVRVTSIRLPGNPASVQQARCPGRGRIP